MLPPIPPEQLSTYPFPMAEDRIISLAEFAAIAGISLITLRRLIARKQGPPVTKISPRRLGIRVRHGRAWLDACAISS
jgi:predicted DNA-binding transcriptional regulator AlpA